MPTRKVTNMRRLLEISFAHKYLLLAPLVAALIGTAGYVLIQPASYQSSATLWVTGGGVGTESAAQAQADIVNQFLKTNSFAMTVAENGPLGGYLNTHGSSLTSQIKGLVGGLGSAQKASPVAIQQYLAAHVTVTQLGPAELSLIVSGPTPAVAKGTANALITQLMASEIAVRTAPDQTQVALYESQLADQSAALTADLAAVRAYLVAHPNLVSSPAAASIDSQLAILKDRATVAGQTYVQLLAKIDQAQSDLALAREPNLAPFSVVDSPQTPSSQSFLGKQQLIAVAAGLLAGFLVLAGMAALLVRLDSTIHTPDDVQRMVGLPVIGTTPLSARA